MVDFSPVAYGTSGHGSTDEDLHLLEALLNKAGSRQAGTRGLTRGISHEHFFGASNPAIARTVGPGVVQDAAVASYGAQLQAWVNLQVDRRLSQVLVGLVQGELAGSRQECAQALAVTERLEGDVSAVTEAQAKLLSVIQRQEAAIGDLRQAARDQEQGILSLQRAELSNEAALVERCEARIISSRAELIGEVGEMIAAAGLARRDAEEAYRLQEIEQKLGAVLALRGDTEARADSLSTELRYAAASVRDLEARLGEARLELRAESEGLHAGLRQDLLELRAESEDLRAAVRQDLGEVQQRLVAMLRSELTQAFRSEAAAVTALDQQLKRRMDGMTSLGMHERAQRELASVTQRPGRAALALGAGAEADSPAMMSHGEAQLQAQGAVARLGSAGLAGAAQPEDRFHHLGSAFSLAMPGAQNAAFTGDVAQGTVRAGHGLLHHTAGTPVAGGSLSLASEMAATTSSLLAEDAQRAKEEVAWLVSKKI